MMSSDAESLVQKINAAQKGHCPAHDDRHSSFSANVRNGKVVVHCFKGCSQEAVIAALERKGLWYPTGNSISSILDSFDAKWEREWEEYERLKGALQILRTAAGAVGDPRHWPTRPPNQEKLRKYFEGRGIQKIPRNALFLGINQVFDLTKERLPQKGIACTPVKLPAMVFPIGTKSKLMAAHVTYLTPDGSENEKDDGKSFRRIYGLMSGGYIVLGNLKADKPLIVAEGVETALSASQLTGYPAIAACSATNMPNLTLPECREVFIAHDNDETGTKAAKTLANCLANAGKRVRLVPPPKKFKDWNDAIRSPDIDQNKLADLFDNADTFESSRTIVDAVGMGEFLQMRFPPREYLLKPWLTTTGLVMIDAPAGHGKTWLALSIGYAVAGGQPLLGWSCERPGRVLYVDGELPGELLQRRLAVLGPTLPAESFVVLSRSQFEAQGELMPDLGTEEGRNALDAIIERHQIDLIILDSVSTLVRSGTDNDVESWREIQDWSLTHRAKGRAVIYLHHHGRSGQPRGTSAREIVLDARIKMAMDDTAKVEADETAFKIEFAKARDFFGADRAPLIARLTTADGTAVSWHCQILKTQNEQVQELLEEGKTSTEIADELKLSRGRISQIKKTIVRPIARQKRRV